VPNSLAQGGEFRTDGGEQGFQSLPGPVAPPKLRKRTPAFDDHYGVIAGPDGDIPVPERLIRLLSAEVELRPSVTAERVEVGPVEGPRPNLLAAMGSRGRLRRRISAILGGQPPSSATVEALQHTDQGLRYLGNRAARVLNLARALERAAASGWPEDESSILRRRRG
jgi:hypothetical protein